MFGELQGTGDETVLAYLKVTLRGLLKVQRKSTKGTSQDIDKVSSYDHLRHFGIYV